MSCVLDSYLMKVIRTWWMLFVPDEGYSYLMKVIRAWWRLFVHDEGYLYMMKVIRTWWRLFVHDEGYSYLMKVIRTWWRLFVPDEGYPYLMKVIRTWWRLFVHDEGYSRNRSCTLNVISTLLLLSLGRHLYLWTISPRGYHPPSSQFWLILPLPCLCKQPYYNVRCPH